MTRIKIIGLYVIAAVLFPWVWLTEQPSAIRQAYWRTFGQAAEMAQRVRSGRE